MGYIRLIWVYIFGSESQKMQTVFLGKSLFEPLFEEPRKWEVSKIGFSRSGMRGELMCPGIVFSAGP
jgi:hypothetical protein